jgi:hypothetical protein
MQPSYCFPLLISLRMNQNLPPLSVYVLDSFLFGNEALTRSSGILISARSLQNQSLQFQVLLETGALFTGLPAHAISFLPNTPPSELRHTQMWDSISSNIEVFCLETLRYMPVQVKLTNDELVDGTYLFSIDYVGENDLSRHPSQWKMTHVVQSTDGQMLIYPQYRIRFLDKGLCDASGVDLPSYTYNTKTWFNGS